MKRPRLALVLLLLGAFALRVWLASGGGQGYWPDENLRYGDAQKAAHHLRERDWGGVADELLGHADHTLFRWVALPPALLDDWLGSDPFRAACYLSLFSVAALGLVWGIARRAGGGTDEAGLAVGLAACASSLFFYSRHLFPYDAALALLLLGLWVGLGGTQLWRMGLAGLVVGAAFLTYNGYWLGGATVLGAILLQPGSWRQHFGRAALAGVGLISAVGVVVVLARLAGHDLVAGWRQTSASITQGDFGAGWRVMGEYLWWTEGPFVLVWVGALAVGGWWGWHLRDVVLLRWVGAVLLLSAGLIVFSDCLHRFVVYGRLVRPLVPLFCLLTARVVVVGIRRQKWPGWAGPALLGVAAASAAYHFSVPLRQEFPAEFIPRARAEARRLQETKPGVYRTIRAEHLWGSDIKASLPPHEVVLRATHPLQFRAYQYEGFSSEQRAAFARHDIAMRLIRLPAGRVQPWGEAVAGGYPGPLRLRVKFPSNAIGRSEPLLTTGSTNEGDFLFVRYQDAAHIRFGFDHWGRNGLVTESIPIDYAQEHELVVSFGPLMSRQPEIHRNRPWAAQLQRLAYVALDGKTVLSAWSDFHPSEPGEISVGENYIGGTSAQQEFAGQIIRLERMPLDQLAGLLPFARLSLAERGPEWGGAPGPWWLRLRLPAGEWSTEPLYSARAGGQQEALLLERVDGRFIRLRLERNGTVFRTAPFEVEPTQVQEFLFSSGLLYPEEQEALFQQRPQWRPLKRLAYAAWNGRMVLLQESEPGPRGEAILAALLAPDGRVERHFSGLVEELGPEDPDRILRAAARLVNRIESRGPEWTGYPGPLKLRLRLPREIPAHGAGEPLVVGGATGAGDFLALFYGPDGGIRIGVDHWGTRNPPVSIPVPVQPGEEFELLISAGFLWPPPDAPVYQAQPAWAEYRERVVVAVNGQVVLDASAAAHASVPEQLTIGANLIGGSTTRESFSGVIEHIAPADPVAITAHRRPR